MVYKVVWVLSEYFIFLCWCHSTSTQCIFIHLSWTLYDLINCQHYYITHLKTSVSNWTMYTTCIRYTICWDWKLNVSVCCTCCHYSIYKVLALTSHGWAVSLRGFLFWVTACPIFIPLERHQTLDNRWYQWYVLRAVLVTCIIQLWFFLCTYIIFIMFCQKKLFNCFTYIFVFWKLSAACHLNFKFQLQIFI